MNKRTSNKPIYKRINFNSNDNDNSIWQKTALNLTRQRIQYGNLHRREERNAIMTFVAKGPIRSKDTQLIK
jgi:hypothetical protein